MKVERLDKFTDDYCEKTGFSGYLQITLKDEIIFKKSLGYEDIESKKPFTDSSMFSLYSLSKPFCAIGIMNLYDKGLCDIDAHPSKYVKQAKSLDSTLTIRHLMQHLSGVPDFYMEKGFEHLSGNRQDILDNLEKLFERPAYFAPGTAAKYANINYNLMALIIENITGKNYKDYMENEILEPLGCPRAIVDMDGLCIEDRVQGYAKTEDGQIVPVSRNPHWMMGAGDIVGCVKDVYRLNHAVKKKLFLSENSWKQILSPSPFNHMGYGCTVKKYGDRIRVTHNGGHTGFRTYHIHILQDDFDVVLLSNSGWGLGRTDIETEIYNCFYGFDITEGQITPMDKGYI